MADKGWVSFVWPVPSSKAITQQFGENYNSYAKMGWTIGHSGLDIRTRTNAVPSGIGTPIVAARGGRINHAGEHFYPNGKPTGYGLAVIIDHSDGSRTLYAHNSRVHVRQGQTVTAGQHIADSGNSGNSTGPHLHFELWRPPFDVDGIWGRVNPTSFIEDIIFEPRFGTRSLDDSQNIENDMIYIERGLEDSTCHCPPFVPSD